MVAARRTRSNFALDRAIELADHHRKPLVVLEALRCDYPFASARLHRFVLDGMAENQREFARAGIRYYPFVEPSLAAGKGLLEAPAQNAVAVVTDDFPCFFLPRMLESAARRLVIPLEAVDSNGLLPMRATDRVFTRAHSFRRFLQKELAPHLGERPTPDPLHDHGLPPAPTLPASIQRRWPAAAPGLLAGSIADLAALPIDASVGPVAVRGGSAAGTRLLERFMEERLDDYGQGRNHPDSDSSSGLSPYLHFGHVAADEVFEALVRREDWTPDRRLAKATGSRHGFWGMTEASETFLDQFVTWRELGFNNCALTDDFACYSSLPQWARTTLEDHAGDPRPIFYSRETLEAGQTHDEVWNAAQRQLVREGRMHNYLRMLWGKKILEWTRSPEQALAVMIELNNRYALDGRDPNSYSGIFWVLGRHDRAWGPERPIFGKIRYMSSDSTRRKLKLKEYLARYAA
jgi:deoxyribodipyrimidine photo-lyase